MGEEIHSIKRNGTWDLVEFLKHKQAINCKWVYKLKFQSDGSIEHHKVRLVAKRFKQKEDIGYEQTFTLVVNMNTIKLILPLVTQCNWLIYQIDVKSTFLNDDLEDEVYLEQPLSYVSHSKMHLVCHLKKALYGLEQAPQAWY